MGWLNYCGIREVSETQNVDFWAPYKTDRNYAETAPYCVVLCTRGKGERGRRNVLATRACGINVQQYGRSMFEKLCVDLWAPYKTPSVRRENGVVRFCALHTGEGRACPLQCTRYKVCVTSTSDNMAVRIWFAISRFFGPGQNGSKIC